MDVILIAGLWLDSSAWDAVVRDVAGRGHHATAVALPGQGDGNQNATLSDQVDAVLTAVDNAAGRPLVVGHSAACTLAWLAADARPDRLSGVALIGGFPSNDGEAYADFFPIVEGAMPFPGWEPFEGADSADLDQPTRDAIASAAIPVPEGVARGVVRWTNERRLDVPVTLICPEFSPDEAKEWIAAGELPELASAKQLSFADIDSGHWPMFSAPDQLGQVLATIAGAS